MLYSHMSNLSYRQQKIQEKRKQTPWRDFVMEVASRYTINLYRNQWLLAKYPDNGRTPNIIIEKDYASIGNQMNDKLYDNDKSFFEQFHNLRKAHKHPNQLTFKQNENAHFADVVFGAKNAYLSFTIGNKAENIAYSRLNRK